MEIQNLSFLIIIIGCLVVGFIIGRKMPAFRKKIDRWSIGIYAGETPFDFAPPGGITNPVLTRKDVTDRKADFVSDPFMVKEGLIWYMFFEVMNSITCAGEIGLAVSNDGLHWKYKQIILAGPPHFSYPYVFKSGNEYYMIPESYGSYSVRLYKAVDFPVKWVFFKTLLQGDFVDSSVFYYGGKWWLLATNYNSEAASKSGGRNGNLCLYYAEDLLGPWIEHPKSPAISGNQHIARSGGRVLVLEGGRIIRYAQDDEPIYGRQVRAFEITELTTTAYKERENSKSPVLRPRGFGWNAIGMHTLDAHQESANKWIACVDGYTRSIGFGR